MHFWFMAFMLFSIFSPMARAVETVAPQAAQSAMPEGSYLGAPKDIYRVFVFGDGLASGLLEALKAQAQTDAIIRIDGRTNDESGLARPEIHDWADAIPKIQQSNEIEIAVVMLGVNDNQPLRDGERGYAVGSIEWQAAYGARVDQIIRLFGERGTAVYWLGLPPMGSVELDARIQAVSEVQKSRVTAAGIKYIDLRGRAGFDWSQLRKPNGVSLTNQGNGRIAELLLSTMRADISVVFATAESAGLTPGQTAAPENITPVFGQIISSGDGVTGEGMMRPAYRPPSMIILGEGDAVAGRRLAEQLSQSTRSGSAAEALFLKGQWPAPKPGRVDDFSAAAMTRP